jgi:hypothetical protein
MPVPRWWNFERNTTDFGSVDIDKHDLARLALVDFMLIQGDDWYITPFHQRIGTLSQMEEFVAHDVFGTLTLIERAETTSEDPLKRWHMFTTSTGDWPAPFFVVAPTAADILQPGVVLEQVRFFRDEAANLVWAVERTVPNAVGHPVSGIERDQARDGTTPPMLGAAPEREDEQASLQYQIQTSLPASWFPFVPMRPDSGDAMLLVRGSLATFDQVPIEPAGRLLRRSRSSGSTITVYEEEVPRIGVQVARAASRTRWVDGSTHIWIARTKTWGGGEGASGLRYDVALPVDRGSS